MICLLWDNSLFQGYFSRTLLTTHTFNLNKLPNPLNDSNVCILLNPNSNNFLNHFAKVCHIDFPPKKMTKNDFSLTKIPTFYRFYFLTFSDDKKK
jgi:hypothetical protein